MDSASHPHPDEDETLKRRRAQEEFIARGLRASEDVRQTGSHHRAEVVHDELQRPLDPRRKALLG
jgi:hypothetical protein